MGILFNCVECGESTHVEEVPRRGEVCFRCHVKGIRLGFAHGKENFHGDTIAEKQRKAVADAKAAGLNPEPVGTRWV